MDRTFPTVTLHTFLRGGVDGACYGISRLFRAIVHYPELSHEPAETGNMATDWNPGVWPESLLS